MIGKILNTPLANFAKKIACYPFACERLKSLWQLDQYLFKMFIKNLYSILNTSVTCRGRFWTPLTIITKSSILDGAVVLDLPLARTDFTPEMEYSSKIFGIIDKLKPILNASSNFVPHKWQLSMNYKLKKILQTAKLVSVY